MKILKKSEADAMLVASVFDRKGSLTPVKYDSGKYKWLGSQQAHIDASASELEKRGGAVAVWFERRADESGPYCQVMALI